MADNVEAILLRLGLDASGFTKGTRQARSELGLMEKGVGSLKGQLASLAATAAGGIGLAILAREALQFAESVTKIHDQTGLAIDSIQFLKFAADQTGTSVDSLAGLVNKMQRQLVEASGNNQLTQQFANIGLSIKELRAQAPEQQLQSIAVAIAAIKDPAEQSAAAVMAFGKSGAEALPELKALATQQAELAEAFRLTGGPVSADAIAAVESLGDSMGQTKTAAIALATELLAGAAPAFKSFLETVTEVIGGLRLLDGEGDNALVNLDNKIVRAEENLRVMEASAYSSFTGITQSTRDAIKAQEELIAKYREEYQALAGLGQGGVNEGRRKAAADALAIQQALADGTLDIVNVTATTINLRRYQDEAEEAAHQARKAEIIAEANKTVLDQDLAFRAQMSSQANLGAIEQQDVLHGGLSKLEQFQADSWDNQVATVAGGLQAMTAGIAQHSKAAFEINKAASMVNTIVQTIQAVTKAWADYGWPYGAVMGAAIAAAGAVQLNAIKSTQFNGGGQGLPPSSATQVPTATASGGNGSGGNGQQVIRMEGISSDSLFSGKAVRQLIDRINEAQKDGAQVLIQS
jgi:hypothetical protein